MSTAELAQNTDRVLFKRLERLSVLTDYLTYLVTTLQKHFNAVTIASRFLDEHCFKMKVIVGLLVFLFIGKQAFTLWSKLMYKIWNVIKVDIMFEKYPGTVWFEIVKTAVYCIQ